MRNKILIKLSNTAFVSTERCLASTASTGSDAERPNRRPAEVRDEADRHVRDETGAAEVDEPQQRSKQLRAREHGRQSRKYS